MRLNKTLGVGYYALSLSFVKSFLIGESIMGKGLPRSLKHASLEHIIPQKVSLQINEIITVAATGSAVGIGVAAVIGDFPEGNICILGAVARLAFAGSGSDANLTDTWNGDFAIGSAPNTDGTLSGSEVDVIPSTAIGPAVAEVIAATRATLSAPVTLDNTDGSLEINLNMLIDAADITDDESVDITVTGTLDLTYQVLGDD
jgi:hypothetical protein